MPIDIVKQHIRAGRRQEHIVLMDDYGAVMHVVIPVSHTSAQRAAKISEATQTLVNGQAQLEAYAAENKIDISGQRLSNMAAKKAKVK
jgi:hypothetical protein